MHQNFDLYEMMRVFSHKTNSPYIRVDTLINLLQRNALMKGNSNPKLKIWLTNTREKTFSELARLSDEKKCVIQGEAPNQRVFLPDFFIEKLEHIYFSKDGLNNKPFPDENFFRAIIPAAFVREIAVDSGMVNYLEEPQDTILPILKLVFAESFGHVLLLSTQMPKRILEAAILKLKYLMQFTRTLAFYQQKLLTRFHGQEQRVKRFFENITVNQENCIEDIVRSDDFTFSAWVFLCPLVKMQVKDTIKRDNDISPESVALYQSASLLLSFNNYYKTVALTKRNKMMAFSALDEKMTEAPYMYTFKSLMKLTGSGGILILQRYTENDLKEWLDRKTELHNEKLPHIFKFKLPLDSDFFVRKDKLFPLCFYLVKDLKSKIKIEITNRWTKLMGDYYKEKAMENDADFEALLIRISKLYAPALISILNDPKFDVLQDEIVAEGLESAKNINFFSDGKMLPLRKMLELNRNALLRYCKLSLPFWHSIPFIVSLGRILKHGIKKDAAYYNESDKQLEINASQYIKDSAKKIAAEIVPDNVTMESYIESILNRWNQHINKQSQERLTKEVNMIIKNYIEHADSLLKQRVLTQSVLDEIAESIIHSNVALARINNKNALHLYIKLFITRGLLN
ncbi:MAG: hypothetical protein LBH18_05950 [Spirochaetaceae bacterium]|nr:hypothetical protein [Spirochaetaceae bacterium]